MPSSRPNTIPTVIHIVKQLRPASILDVGIGFGKWGHLFREYTDIIAAEHDPKRYQRKNWRVRIDGIEGHTPYLTPMHRFLYNNIYVGDARDVIKRLPRYDLVFLGDIIEHLEKPYGMSLIEVCARKARKAVVLSTPKYETLQDDLCGNVLERHRSLWSDRDFKNIPRAQVKTIDRDTLLVVITSPGTQPPDCTPPKAPARGVIRRFELTRRALVEHVPATEKFIIVDEDQMRHDLPHRRAFPFLEKGGQYWGPPADDETAVRELERLCRRGATAIAFTWPCFWWLEHYGKLAEYLERRGSIRLRTPNIAIYDLGRRRHPAAAKP